MRTSLHKLPAIILAATFTALLLTSATGKDDWAKQADQRKADYLFLEAQSAYSDGTLDRYVTFIDRAFQLAQDDPDIAGEWALFTLIDELPDSATGEKAYSLLQKRYLSNPRNMISGAIFANVAQSHKRYADAVRVWEMLDSIYPTKPQPALQLAGAYLGNFMTGDTASFSKAIAIYDRIESGSGKSIELTNQKIRAYYMKGDTTAILRELASLSESSPKDSYAALFVGAHYQYLDKPKEAIKYYDLACELDSTNGSAYLSRAKFYSAEGDSAAFDREVFHALMSQNLDFDSKLEMLKSYVSDLYTDRRQEPRIKELFTTLQQQHTGEPQVHELYGAYLYEIKDYQGATEQFSYATALDPAEESSWTSYLQMAAMAMDTTTVAKVAAEARERFPKNLYFPIMSANVYRMADRYDLALDILNSVDLSVVENETAVSNFLTTKADTYAALGDTLQALDTYEEAIKLYPDNKMAMNNAAYFMAQSGGDLDKAENYSARSLKGDELNPTYLDTYAWILFKKKDYKMAKHYIDIALNSYTEEETIPETEGYDEETEIEEDPNEEEDGADQISAEVYDHAGDIYFMNGENAQAIKFWEKALTLDPEDEIIQKKVKHKTIFLR